MTAWDPYTCLPRQRKSHNRRWMKSFSAVSTPIYHPWSRDAFTCKSKLDYSDARVGIEAVQVHVRDAVTSNEYDTWRDLCTATGVPPSEAFIFTWAAFDK